MLYLKFSGGAKNGDDENEEKEEEPNEELEIALAGLEADFGGGNQAVTAKPPAGPSALPTPEKTAPEKNYKIKVASPTKENHLHKKFKRRYSNPRPVSEPEPVTDIIMPSVAPRKTDSPLADQPVISNAPKSEAVDTEESTKPEAKPVSPKKERRASVVKVSPEAMRRNSNPEVVLKQKLPVDAAGPVSAAAIPTTRVLQEETQRRLSSISCNSESSLPSKLEHMVPAATQPVPAGHTDTGSTLGTPTRTHIVTGPIGSLATPTIKLPGAGGTPTTPKVLHQIGGAKNPSPQVVGATHQHIVTMPRSAPQAAFAQNIIHSNQQQIKLVKLNQSQASPVTIRATPQTVVAHSQTVCFSIYFWLYIDNY